MSLTKTLSAVLLLAFNLSPLHAKDETKTNTKKTTTTPKETTTKPKTTTTKSKTTTTAKKTTTAPKATTSKTKTTTKGITVADPKTAAANKKSAATLSSAQNKSMLSILNKGTTEDLIKIPGLGEKTIALIKKARPYKGVTDLGNVTGIGQKKFSDIVAHFKSKK